MAKGNKSAGGRGLNIKAKLDVADAKRDADSYIKKLKQITDVAKIAFPGNDGKSKTFDVRPLTEYQAGLLRIKEEALNFAKVKANDAAETKARLQEEKKAAQEKSAAEKSASLATQAALKEEARLKREQIALAKQSASEANSKKRPTQISNSQAEIDAYKKAQQGSVLYTSAINNEVVARAKLNAEAVRQAVANGTLNTGLTYNTQATQQQTQATNQNVLSKKQLAQMLAEEKYRQQQSTAELKNNAREMLNAKGSLEQRRAALIRLITVYDRLSKAERESAAGKRLESVIKGVANQVFELEKLTLRAQRNVGNYPNPFKKIGEDADKVKDKISGSGDIFTRIFSAIGSGAASILGPLAAIGTVWTAVKNIFSHNVEISDAFADVRRTAKLSADEVNNLADTLKGLDTRTNLEGLLDIGFIGGRLGVKKSDLPDFIKQVDELAVVLKKELPGGAEAVAESLGKIVTVYKVTQAEGISLGDALSKVGSNMLELAHSGPVTVRDLQAFTLGVAGTAASAKLSIPVISAYGAVLLESGQIASSSALSVTRLVTGLTTKTGKYAAIAQLADATLTVEKFTKIVNTDTKQALDLFFKGLKAGNPVPTEFAARLASVGITTGKVTNAVKVLAENQDKLANRIAKGTVAFEDGITVAHNFEIANDTLGSSVDKLGNSITNLTTNPDSNMYNFFKGVIDGSTKAVSALDIFISTVKGLSTDPKKFIGDSAAKAQSETILKINEEAKRIAATAYKDIDTNPDKERLEILKKEVKIRDVIQTQYLKAKIAYENTPQKDRSLTETYKFQEVETRFQKQVALVRELNKLRNKGSVDVIGTGELVQEENNGRTTEDIKADIKELQNANKKLAITSSEFKGNVVKIKALRKELKTALGGDVSGPAVKTDTAFNSQRSLQQEIQALVKKGSDKQKSQDQQELADVDAKYTKLRQKAIRFNSDPKNKARGLQVDVGGLALAQSTESDALRDKQSSEKLKVSLDKEQDLFAAYEDAKTKIGKDKAAERYKDQIDTDRTYLESLEMQREAILNPQKSKGGEEVDTEANQLQLKVLNEAIEKEKSVQQKKYDDLLASLQTFEQESKALTQQYEADKADLTAKNDTKQLEQATKVYNQRLAELGDNHLKEMDAFKLLYAGIDDLSDQNARKVLGNAEDALKSLQTKGVVLSKELVAELNKLFKGTKAAIADRLPEKIISLANQIDSVAGAVSGVNAEFGKILSTLGNVIGQVGNIKKGMVDLKTANSKGDAFGAASAGLGIFGAGISILSSVVKLFDRSAQREEQAAYARDLQNKQTEALNKALERQIALLNDAYGTDRINKYSEAIKAAQENEAKYREQLSSRLQLTGNKQLDEQIQKFNNGEKQTGVFGKVFTDLLKQGAFSGLPTDIASLQKLLDEGKLDANTATIVENLIKANQSAKELANNLKAENVGSSIDEIADSFLSTLTDGTRDFGKSFEEVIRKSIINGFKQKLIEEQLQPFYNTFAELSKGGLTEDEIKTLQASYMGAADKAKQMAEDLKKATGIDITNPLKDKEGISGVITSAGLTEDTGNRAMGLWQGQYDQTKKIALSTGDIYRISVDNLTYVKQIAANTKRGADNTDGLGEKLDAIIANTDPDASGSTSLSQALRNSGIK
jgi:TP901 family phage tail tape measure protein